MFSAVLTVAGVLFSIFLICVIVAVIKKVLTPSTIDVTNPAEVLLLGRARGIRATSERVGH